MSVQIYSAGEGAGTGALGGAIAGAVMLLLMVAMNIETGNMPFASQVMIGMMVIKGITLSTYVGIGLHMVASILVGLIFGVVTSADRLKLTSIGNGIGLGIVTGMISFVVIFLPLMMFLIPQQMIALTQMMNPNITSDTIMQNIQASMPAIINNTILIHIIYGAVLGAITTGMLRKVSVYKCLQCHTMFRNEKRFREHLQQQHISH